jgi:hypothetical protein
LCQKRTYAARQIQKSNSQSITLSAVASNWVIGQVSIPEQKASVSAALFSHAALAADSMAPSDTSTVRIAWPLYGAPLNSLSAFSCFVVVDLTGETEIYSRS